MKPSPVTIHRPTTVEETLDLLGRHGSHGKILAGGQSLIPVLNMRLAAPEHLIDITDVGGLSDIQVSRGRVRVGALVTHRQLERNEAAFAAQPVLRSALVNVAHPAIRNRGTTVGSLAHADPNGEMPAILALCDGTVEVVSSRGKRTLSAAELNVGPLETSLEADELITHAEFAALAENQAAGFDELTRRSGDYALAGVGAILGGSSGQLDTLRLTFVSVTDLPSVLDLGAELAGADLAAADDLSAHVSERVKKFVDPVGDIHASADYRRHLTGVLAQRLVTSLAKEFADD